MLEETVMLVAVAEDVDIEVELKGFRAVAEGNKSKLSWMVVLSPGVGLCRQPSFSAWRSMKRSQM